MKKKKKEKTKERLKPISLHPLEPEEALKDILKVKLSSKEKPNSRRKSSK